MRGPTRGAHCHKQTEAVASLCNNCKAADLTRVEGVVKFGFLKNKKVLTQDYTDLPSTLNTPGRTLYNYRNVSSFAGLTSTGELRSWGGFGLANLTLYYIKVEDIADEINAPVSQIVSNLQAFAAILANGKVVTWGCNYTGGDSTKVASLLDSGVTRIFSTGDSFHALKEDGSLVSWGFDQDQNNQPNPYSAANDSRVKD